MQHATAMPLGTKSVQSSIGRSLSSKNLPPLVSRLGVRIAPTHHPALQPVSRGLRTRVLVLTVRIDLRGKCAAGGRLSESIIGALPHNMVRGTLVINQTGRFSSVNTLSAATADAGLPVHRAMPRTSGAHEHLDDSGSAATASVVALSMSPNQVFCGCAGIHQTPP